MKILRYPWFLKGPSVDSFSPPLQMFGCNSAKMGVHTISP